MATSEAAGIQRKVRPIKQRWNNQIVFMQLLGGGGLQEVYTSQNLTNCPWKMMVHSDEFAFGIAYF